MSAEGGVQPKEYLSKYIAERVRNVSGTWLGATFGCCECHNHKFDPFLAKDFYSLEAFFADIEERGLYSGADQDGNWGPTDQTSDARTGSRAGPARPRNRRRPQSARHAHRLNSPQPNERGRKRSTKNFRRRSRPFWRRRRQVARTPARGIGRLLPLDRAGPRTRRGQSWRNCEQAAASLKRQIPSTLITVSVTPRTIRLLHRGNWMDESGAVMHAGFSGSPVAFQAA